MVMMRLPLSVVTTLWSHLVSPRNTLSGYLVMLTIISLSTLNNMNLHSKQQLKLSNKCVK